MEAESPFQHEMAMPAVPRLIGLGALAWIAMLGIDFFGYIRVSQRA